MPGVLPVRTFPVPAVRPCRTRRTNVTSLTLKGDRCCQESRDGPVRCGTTGSLARVSPLRSRVRSVDEPAFDFTEAIAEHSAGFAAAADGNLDAEVEHCPGWTVADLVRHLTEVHWFWATIAEERLGTPPGADRLPAEPPRARLVENFRAGADWLVRVLRAASGSDPVWTWAPAQQDIAFIRRH